MCDPRLAPYSSQPKRNDLSITALTPPQSRPLITTIYLHDMQHETTTQCTPHIDPIKPFKEQKKIPNAFDRRKIPSPAVFICCIFRQVFFSTHIARASSETKPGGHRASKRVAPLFGGGTCVSCFNPSKPGVWGLGACLGVFHEGRNRGLADLIPYLIIYLLDLREMYLHVLT